MGRGPLRENRPETFFAWASKADVPKGSRFARAAQLAFGGYFHAHVGGNIVRGNRQCVFVARRIDLGGIRNGKLNDKVT